MYLKQRHQKEIVKVDSSERQQHARSSFVRQRQHSVGVKLFSMRYIVERKNDIYNMLFAVCFRRKRSCRGIVA